MFRSIDDSFIEYDREFAAVVGRRPRFERVVETDAHEGPVYVADEASIYFTTVPRITDIPQPGSRHVAIKRLVLDGDRFPLEPDRLSVVREPANVANGMTLDRDGSLLVCEQGSRTEPARISRLDLASGACQTVIEHCAGRPLNSPNDVVVKRDGTIWFTDPSYGALQGFRPAPRLGDHVYRYDPRRDHLSVVADIFDKPNGLAFSPDESVLYVADSGAIQEPGNYSPGRPHHVVALDVVAGQRLVSPRRFAETDGFPDGLKVDVDGRVYVSSSRGVMVYNPTGRLIGEIRLPGAVNFTFGGKDRNILFITADSAIWAATLVVAGPIATPATGDVVLAG